MKRFITVLTTLQMTCTLLTVALGQNVGINTNVPENTLDIRSLDITTSGSINLGNSDNSNFLKVSGGSSLFPSPIVYWPQGNPLLFATSENIFSEKMRIGGDGNVGIHTTAPSQALDVGGKIKVGDDNVAPEAGTVRWNAATNDFEGYNGSEWLSLTLPGGGWGESSVHENMVVAPTPSFSNARLGTSVAIRGDVAIVGAPGAGFNGEGRAHVFRKNASGWEFEQHLIPSEKNPGDEVGCSVAIDGDYAIVGAQGHKVNDENFVGRAFVFKYENEAWVEQDILYASDSAAYSYFGFDVDIQGSTAVIGAKYHTVSDSFEQGKVYIFERNGSSWSEQTTLVASDGASNHLFGASVSIDSNYLLVGASGALLTGKVYVFKKSGENWAEQTSFIASDGLNDDHFGESVALEGPYAIVGAPQHASENGIYSGQAYIFQQNPDESWTQSAILMAPEIKTHSGFGSSVAISADHVVVGANLYDHGEKDNMGCAHIFKRVGSSWLKQAFLIPKDGAAYDEFGTGVGISGTTTIVGAPQHATYGFYQRGLAYFFLK